MMNNSSKQNEHEDLRNEIINKNLAVKRLVNFISTGSNCTYRGSCNKAFFFSRQDEQYLNILILQQFSLNRQTKILKKWDTKFIHFKFINKSNQFFASDESEGSLWKIDSAYNLKVIEKKMFSYVQDDDEEEIVEYPYLVLSKNNDLIIISKDIQIQFIIKQNNGIWKVQQIENVSHDSVINGLTLNEQENILIVTIDTDQQSQNITYKLLIYLKIEKQWKRIEEIDFPNPNTYCFIDNDKFAYLKNNDKSQKIIIWKVFQDTLEVKIVQKQKLLISEFLTQLIYMKDRDLFLALSYSNIYFIKQINDKCQLLETIKISEYFELENSVNEEFLIFKDFANIIVSKLYGF